MNSGINKGWVILLMILWPSFGMLKAQNKHSASTLYPNYEGLVMAGYQGWFRAPDDGSGSKGFSYFSDTNHAGIDMWPDVREYQKTYATPFKFSDGSTARLFSSYDESTVDLHFKWMQQYGIDGVFMQRFFGTTKPGHGRDASTVVLKNALQAASKYKRAIAVMYDLSGLQASGEDCSSVIEDWKYLVDSIRATNQPGTNTYLHFHGKPVVAIWGLGFPDRPYNIRDIGIMRLIDFLKNDPVYGGCAIMIGVPTYWRELDNDCVNDPYLHTVIKSCDIVLPWMVQRFSPLLHNDMVRYRDLILKDEQWCNKNHLSYVPCIYPGFSWHNLSMREFPDDIKPLASIPREGGRFFWQQVYTSLNAGAKMLYVAMFDEINEGTAIFKSADNPPSAGNTHFTGLEGKPSDYYLWLTGQTSSVLKGKKALTLKLPER